MNKTSKGQAPQHLKEPSRLDERITNFIAALAKIFQRIWLPLVLICAAAFFIAMVWAIVGWLHDSKENALNDRLFSLIKSGSEAEADFPQILAGLDELMRDSRGSDSERRILKDAVSFLKEKLSPADAESYYDSLEGEGPGSKASAAASKNSEPALAKIEEFAKIGQENFAADDEDMKIWAEGVLAWVEAERKFLAEAPPKRTFAPKLSGVGPSVPAPEAPPAPPKESPPGADQGAKDAPAPEAPPATPKESPPGADQGAKDAPSPTSPAVAPPADQPSSGAPGSAK